MVAIVLGVGLLLRAAACFAGPPWLSDDLYRYVFDGATLAAGENPYAAAPVEVPDRVLFSDATRSLVYLRMNRPELVTIYQPTSQWVFAGLASLHSLTGAEDSQTGVAWDPLGTRTFRLGLILFDLWIVAMILLKLLHEGRSPWLAALYAWHPLAIAEAAGSGHQDVIGLAWLMAAMLLADAIRERSKGGAIQGTAGPSEETRDSLSCGSLGKALALGFAFALAVGAKPIVAPLALPIAWSLWRRPRVLAIAGPASAATLAALYLPFVLMPGGMGRMLGTIRVFVDKWEFNGSLHSLVTAAVGSKSVADAAMAVVLLAALIVPVLKRCDPWRCAMIYLFAGVLVTSTAHPWYLLWALAFLPIRFGAAAWVLSLTILWSYAALLDPEGAFRVPLWLRIAEYLPVYAVLVWEWWKKPRKAHDRQEPQGSQDVTTAAS